MLNLDVIQTAFMGSILQYFRPSLSYHSTKTFILSIFKWPLKTGFIVAH